MWGMLSLCLRADYGRSLVVSYGITQIQGIALACNFDSQGWGEMIETNPISNRAANVTRR